MARLLHSVGILPGYIGLLNFFPTQTSLPLGGLAAIAIMIAILIRKKGGTVSAESN